MKSESYDAETIEGVITFSEAAPEQSAVTFSIQAASIDTNEKDRDTHLRSADFFDVEHHPTITFVSASVKKNGANGLTVEGTLTIRGMAKDPWGNQRAGFEAEITLNRKEFGLNWNAALEAGGFLVGDEVKVTLSIQAVAQP